MFFATNKKSDEDDLNDLYFAWKVVKHVRSNAIVITKDNQTVGVGTGQINRIGVTEMALKGAKAHGNTEDLTLASDAFSYMMMV